MGNMARFFGGGNPVEVTHDVLCLQDRIVNLFLVGEPGRNWVLVDTGLFGSASRIKRMALKRFGKGSKPRAIILTHGHFDHVGAVKKLSREWDVPVYAHFEELPYLTGRTSYPKPDPRVGGGAMARLSFIFPRKPIDISDHINILPSDGSVPEMPGWRWIHTPGHSAGHVSFYRDKDALLIAGDAFVTTKQESFISVITQKKEVHRPPAYFTTDWNEAHSSVKKLAALEPEIAVTGHGLPMQGNELRRQLVRLANEFRQVALPQHGRYVLHPVHG